MNTCLRNRGVVTRFGCHLSARQSQAHTFYGTGAGTYNIGFSHYTNGALKAVTYPDGEVVTNSYTAATGLLSLADSNTTTFQLDSIDYDQYSRVESIIYGNNDIAEQHWYYNASSASTPSSPPPASPTSTDPPTRSPTATRAGCARRL